MSNRLSALVLLLVLVLAASPGPAAGAAADGEAARGRLLFRIHCASCHGVSAHGDGSVAEFLKVPPSDLTRIAPAKDGSFPAERLERTIDGREEVVAHGQREMPVWGLSFQVAGRDSDQEREVETRIRELVAYLRSIQAEPAD